jgi:dTDP-4-amino-4,6-dideoxygalactose transaminase
MRQTVPFVDLKSQYFSIQQQIDRAIHDVISETAFIGGKYVKDFERAFAEMFGVGHVISCANGTDSLYILMKVLGIGNGDEVITVANSWISSSETISQTGAKPVFVDIDPVYFSMDEKLLESVITPRTTAVIAVHLHGQMCRIDAIRNICDRKGLMLIEDCAQAHLSEYRGIKAGLTGIAGSFSFYPGKNLGAYGDAGCIITNDAALAERCRMYANHGALVKHQHLVEGINSRLDGLQAAILTAKLPYLPGWTEKRIQAAGWYSDLLSDCPFVVTPAVRQESKHSFHLYVIRAKRRDELIQFLKDGGVECAIHYPTILPLLPAYRYLGHNASDFPKAYACQQEIISLPIYPELTRELAEYVVHLIKLFYIDRGAA